MAWRYFFSNVSKNRTLSGVKMKSGAIGEGGSGKSRASGVNVPPKIVKSNQNIGGILKLPGTENLVSIACEIERSW